MPDLKVLNSILKELKQLKARWYDPEEIDVSEEMLMEVPEFLGRAVPRFEKALRDDLPLRIINAKYGAADSWEDVTEIVDSESNGFSLELEVSNHLFGDPIYGEKKTLKLVYKYNGRKREIERQEGSRFRIGKKEK